MRRFPLDRRRFLARLSASSVAGLAGCVSDSVRPGRDGQIRNFEADNEYFERPQLEAGESQYHLFYAPHFFELEYTFTPAHDTEGYAEMGPVNVVVANLEPFFDYDLDEIKAGELYLPGASTFDLNLDSETEVTQRLPAGIYQLVIDNTEANRNVIFDLQAFVYRYVRDPERVTCPEPADSKLQIELLHVNTFNQDIYYHITLDETDADSYTMELRLLGKERDIETFTVEQSPDSCRTHFVGAPAYEDDYQYESDLLVEIVVSDGETEIARTTERV
ncbi:hypothetical protein [Haloarchaeobius sp. DYHT-AS-18]|uniref:hypothetical protein n=1 Tax=Haloarchaeobius sp. DYHT-AS-18 TaxID=3446117 RepID=UPI003EC0BF78